MDATDERLLIYTALILLCSAISVFLGVAAGLWSFVQVAAAIEILYWAGHSAHTSEEQFQSVK